MLRGSLTFVLVAGATYLVMATAFALLCFVTGHGTVEMLYGTTATFTLATAAGMVAVWCLRY